MKNEDIEKSRRGEKLQLLSDLFTAVTLAETVEEKIQMITEKVREIIGCHQAITSMTVHEKWPKVTISFSEKYAQWRGYSKLEDGSGILSYVYRMKKPIRMTQAELEAHPVWRSFDGEKDSHLPMQGLLAVPLVYKNGKNIGFIQLSDKYEGEFTKEDEAILVQLGQMIAIAIENLHLFQQLEEALQEKDKIIKLNRTITDNATSALFMMDGNGYCTFMNPAGEKMFGYTFEEIRKKPLHYLIHYQHPDGSFYPMEDCPIDRALPENFDIRAHEDVFLRKDGTFIPVVCAASPIFENGTPVSTVIEVRDITEEKRIQRVLLENVERIRFILEAMPQKVWTAKADGNVDYFNNNWLNYTGMSFEELKDWGWKKIIHPNDWQENERVWQESINTGKDFQLEHRFLRKDGEYRWHLSRGLALKDATGHVMMWIGTNTDIHDVKIAEEELLIKNKELQKVNADLDSFIYTASHDLKSPIANIEGLIAILHKKLEGSMDSSSVKVIEMIEKSIAKFKSTIFDLTEISKVQKNVDEQIEEVVFEEVLADVKADLQEMINETEVFIKEDLQVNTILYARRNLRSILYNLLSNAIKYCSPERAPFVLIRVYRENEFIVLSVQDNGLGLSRTQQTKIFDMFKRVHSHVEGTGVGLYIVKRIVENSGGYIEVESQVDQGTTFTIYFSHKPKM